jgi:hypothetical protein
VPGPSDRFSCTEVLGVVSAAGTAVVREFRENPGARGDLSLSPAFSRLPGGSLT